MSELGLLYSLHNIGYQMLEFFSWFFGFMNTRTPWLNNSTVIEVAFSSAISIYVIKSIIDALAGNVLPGD